MRSWWRRSHGGEGVRLWIGQEQVPNNLSKDPIVLKLIFHQTPLFVLILLAYKYKVKVANMTCSHDDTSHATFNSISGTCWKVSEVIDFDLKNRNSNLPACFSVLICDFSQFIKIPLSKTTKIGFYEYCANLLFMDLWKWGKWWAIYKFIHLEILFLLTYHTRAKDVAVMKLGMRNDFRSSCLYDTLNKLSWWHTFSNMAKTESP